MGRKRIDKDNKRIGIHLTLPKYLIDLLKDRNIVISQLVEKLLKKYLKLK